MKKTLIIFFLILSSSLFYFNSEGFSYFEKKIKSPQDSFAYRETQKSPQTISHDSSSQKKFSQKPMKSQSLYATQNTKPLSIMLTELILDPITLTQSTPESLLQIFQQHHLSLLTQIQGNTETGTRMELKLDKPFENILNLECTYQIKEDGSYDFHHLHYQISEDSLSYPLWVKNINESLHFSDKKEQKEENIYRWEIKEEWALWSENKDGKINVHLELILE